MKKTELASKAEAAYWEFVKERSTGKEGDHAAFVQVVSKLLEPVVEDLEHTERTMARVKEIEFKEGESLRVGFGGDAVRLMALGMADFLKEAGAENLCEAEAQHPELGPLTITVQRKLGKTAMELRGEAEAKSDFMRKGIEEIASQGCHGGFDKTCCDEESDPVVLRESWCAPCLCQGILDEAGDAGLSTRDYIKRLTAKIVDVETELEQTRVQLAGCLLAAEGSDPNEPAKDGDYGWSLAYQRTVELRRHYQELLKVEAKWKALTENMNEEAEMILECKEDEAREGLAKMGICWFTKHNRIAEQLREATDAMAAAKKNCENPSPARKILVAGLEEIERLEKEPLDFVWTHVDKEKLGQALEPQEESDEEV